MLTRKPKVLPTACLPLPVLTHTGLQAALRTCFKPSHLLFPHPGIPYPPNIHMHTHSHCIQVSAQTSPLQTVTISDHSPTLLPLDLLNFFSFSTYHYIKLYEYMFGCGLSASSNWTTILLRAWILFCLLLFLVSGTRIGTQ